jgi:hypothetical protein
MRRARAAGAQSELERASTQLLRTADAGPADGHGVGAWGGGAGNGSKDAPQGLRAKLAAQNAADEAAAAQREAAVQREAMQRDEAQRKEAAHRDEAARSQEEAMRRDEAARQVRFAPDPLGLCACV